MLNFDGNAKQAADFYSMVFESPIVQVQTYADAQIPGFEDKILYAEIHIGGTKVMLSDCPPQITHKPGENFIMSYSNDCFDDLKKIFGLLAEGGAISAPLEKTFFSELYGMVVDKFGIIWNIIHN